MLSWQELSQQFQQTINSTIRFVKARRREESTIGLAAILFWLGYYFPKWLTPELKDWIGSWHGLLIIPSVFFATGAVLLCYGGYRLWQLNLSPDFSPPQDRPSAIKGPLAFAPADGELFRRLGREEELRKLLGFIEDDQVRLVIVTGASGVGKTSLLRAGLTHVLKNKNIDYHYWEAIPTSPGQRLLRAIQESWQSSTPRDPAGAKQSASSAKPASLEDLVNLAPALSDRRHVIVIDQFEQLHGSGVNNPILRLLHKIAREAKPPHLVTWIVAFRREFRPEWEDFTMPEKERGIYPAEISLHLFTPDQAREVISHLVAEAQLSIQQKVVDNLVVAATVDGEVSPVDIGIGLQVLTELHNRHGGQTVTLDVYQFAGEAVGLLTQYISRCLDSFLESDRQTLINAMLALREPGTYQRIAEGRTCAELAQEIKTDVVRLQIHLDRLTQRDMRLLETIILTDESSVRYRLPHERLIPALNRVAGQLLAEVDQTRLKFENAFAAWMNSNQRAQYLLKAGDLRAVDRYEAQIPWGKNAAEKHNFLRRSQRRLTLHRIGITILLLSLLISGWLGNKQYRRFEARTYLTDNHYPPELYDWQHQLKILKLNDEVDVHRFPWLHSDSLEELTITVPKTANSLEGLANLADCHGLKKLTLILVESHINDLTPLSQLTALPQLHLILGNSQANDLTPLSKLSSLTQLDINLDSNQAYDLTPLSKLSSLTRLGLTLNSSETNDLAPLAELHNLRELNLLIGPNQAKGLTGISKLPALKQLKLQVYWSPMDGKQDIDLTPISKLITLRQLDLLFFGPPYPRSTFSDLTPLSKLTALTQLNLNVATSQVSDLTPLSELTALTKLTLNLSGCAVSDLMPLMKLTALRELNIFLNKSEVSDLTPLSKLTGLTQLNLNLGHIQASALTPLANLPALKQLDLTLESSEVDDLLPLASLTTLMQSKFRLYNSFPIDPSSMLTPLSKLTALTQLDIDLNSDQVADLTPLSKLTALTELKIRFFGFSQSDETIDITPLAKLTALEQLALHGNRTIDLTPLSNLSALKRLNLSVGGSQETNLTPLSTLTALTELDLHLYSSQAIDLTPLAKLGALRQLALMISSDQASDLAPLTKLSTLRELKLSFSKNMSDLTPLANLSSCQTLVLRVNSNQRMLLKAIPPSITHLEF